MKAFILATACVVAIAISASVLLERFQHSSETAYTGPGVRIDADHSAPPKG